MKKHTQNLLVLITLLFAAFTAGFMAGRSRNPEPVVLSSLPETAAHSSSTSAFIQETASPVVFPVNINTADMEQLTALPGIGQTLARRILDYREQNGSFARPEELLNVEGIGTGKLEAILNDIVTGG